MIIPKNDEKNQKNIVSDKRIPVVPILSKFQFKNVPDNFDSGSLGLNTLTVESKHTKFDFSQKKIQE
jgi:hypothetical protein